MLVANFIKTNGETLKLLSKFGVHIDDFKYIDLFSDYEEMLNEGNKITYIVSVLSDKYSISEATVYRVLKRFKATI